jgi:sugar/nucleoside kinase (ribokinase family)
MPNAVEAQRITGESELSVAINRLAQITSGIVVKNGAEGAIAYFDSMSFHSGAFEVTPLDTTGAGDSFNAGFLAAYLQNLPIKTCLHWGNYCGAQSTLGYGASNAPSAVPDEEPVS